MTKLFWTDAVLFFMLPLMDQDQLWILDVNVSIKKIAMDIRDYIGI